MEYLLLFSNIISLRNKFHDLYSSPDIIRVVKSRKWDGWGM